MSLVEPSRMARTTSDLSCHEAATPAGLPIMIEEDTGYDATASEANGSIRTGSGELDLTSVNSPRQYRRHATPRARRRF